MGAGTQGAVLRHGLVHGRHLNGGVNEAIQVQAVQLRVVHGQHLAARAQEVGFRLWVAFENRLRILFAADNDLRQRFADGALILRGRVICSGTKRGQKLLRALANIGPSADVGAGIGKAVRQNRGINQHRRAGGSQLLHRFQESRARLRLQRRLRVVLRVRKLRGRCIRADALKYGCIAIQDERRHCEPLPLERAGL